MLDKGITAETKLQIHVVILIVYVVLVVLVILSCLIVRHNRPWLEFEGRDVLLITAHPDDECMFFGPVISDASKVSSSFSLLCLTKGTMKTKYDRFSVFLFVFVIL